MVRLVAKKRRNVRLGVYGKHREYEARADSLEEAIGLLIEKYQLDVDRIKRWL